MKVCGVEDITGASGAPNLGSIPSRPVTQNVSKVYIMVHGLNRRFLRAGRRRLSLVHLIFIAIILYLLLRWILVPLLWILFLVVTLIVILKVVLEIL
jgi:hypothetical protein